MTNSVSSFHSPGTHCSLNSLFSRNCEWPIVWILTSHIPFLPLIRLWLPLLLNRWGPFSRHVSISALPTTHLSGLLCKEEAGYCTPSQLPLPLNRHFSETWLSRLQVFSYVTPQRPLECLPMDFFFIFFPLWFFIFLLL